jgi:tRNA-binding EMAP/Myf-like protein
MTAIAMRCIKAEKHPNADALNLYQFVCPQKTDPVQIVANFENIYEVGDNAIVVMAGSLLKDGTAIRAHKIRNIASYGMALGKTDAPEGTDLTEEYCRPEPAAGSLIAWPHIESLFNVRKYLQKANLERKVKYAAKIKLDGSCYGAQLPPSDQDGLKVIPQSHARVINVKEDNMGSAAWTVSKYNFFLNVRKNADSLGLKDHLVIFGEWAGQGVQRRCAISKIDKRVLAIFAIQIGTIDGYLETDPDEIAKIIGPHNEQDVFIIPWYGKEIELDYANEEQLKTATEVINQMVADVEKCDPWVKETFGVEGLGEGVVMYPILEGKTLISKQDYTDLVFKAKGEAHKVVNAKKPAQINPEFVSTINEFVDLFCTENRLEQIAQKVGGIDMKNIGQFLKEFGQDVQRESEAELEASGLQWKQVAKAVMDKSRAWWMAQVKK